MPQPKRLAALNNYYLKKDLELETNGRNFLYQADYKTCYGALDPTRLRGKWYFQLRLSVMC